MNDDHGPDSTPVSNPVLREVRLQLLLAAGLVTLFIARQAWIQHQAVAASRAQVEKLQSELSKMSGIRDAFARFGADHRGFVPILNKYGIQPPGASAPSVPRP